MKKDKKEERKKEIVDKVLFALNHKVRMEILIYLYEKKSAAFGDLRTNLNLNSNTLSFHLDKLKKAFLVDQKEKGGLYRLKELGETMTYPFYCLLREGGLDKILEQVLNSKQR